MSAIVIVDDSPEFSMFLASALELDGFSVESFQAAAPAFDYLASAVVEAPAFIFVDLNMTGMSGQDFVVAIRALPKILRTQIFMTSAEEEVATIAHRIGASGYLKKPFTLDELSALFTSSEKHDDRDYAWHP